MLKDLKWYGLFLLLVLVFIWLTGFNGLYGQDSYEYLRYTKCLSVFVKTGTSPGDYFWPLLYPIVGAIFSFVFPLPFSLQLISVLSLLGAAVYLEKIIVLIFNAEKNWARLYVFLFFLFSPYMLRGSLVVMSDSLSIFCMVAAWYYFERYRRVVEHKFFLAFVFFFAAAIAARYAAFVVLVTPAIIMSVIFLRNFKVSLLLLSICIVTLLFFPHFLIRSHDPLGFLYHEWVLSWSPLNFFHNRFNTIDGIASYSFYNMLYAFFNILHPAFYFAGIVFLIICLATKNQIKDKKMGVLIIAVSLYAIFLAGIPFQNLRFLLLSFPLVLIALFPGYNVTHKYLIKKGLLKYGIGLVLVIQLGLFYKLFGSFYNNNKTEKQVAAEMLKYPGTVYTFSIDGALKAYGFKGNIINMYNVKVDTLKNADTNAYVLFNVKQFAEQWKNKNPMMNWEYLNKKYALVQQEEMPNGWTLYRIR